MQERSTLDWVALLEPNAVPCAPILDLPGVFQQPQVVARGMKIGMNTGAERPMPLVANPMRFDGQRAIADQPPPGLDAQGDPIRRALAQGPGWPAR
jgi:crotonobetainyl-CoA:carnitine CoA-transferase CaiB-like acyl-CoA transferase